MSTGKRRPRGDGAVYFHKKKQSGLWAAQLELPRGLDGKRQRHMHCVADYPQQRPKGLPTKRISSFRQQAVKR